MISFICENANVEALENAREELKYESGHSCDFRTKNVKCARGTVPLTTTGTCGVCQRDCPHDTYHRSACSLNSTRDGLCI